jgi:cell division transport system permease protein
MMNAYNPKVYLLRHAQVMLSSLGQLWRQPFASLMTIFVIAIALTLPAGLYVLLSNLEQVSNQQDDASQISLFLHDKTSVQKAEKLAEELTTWSEIAQVDYQSAQQSLEEFRQLSGMDDLLDTLPNNPLPALIIVTPNESHKQADTMTNLVDRLEALSEVDIAKLDMEWLQRLKAISELIQRGIHILAILLSLSVLLVIGNTIRLSILSRHAEIKIIKLVGGTDAFVQRPFLYTGFWYGFLGGLLAWFTLLTSLILIDGPLAELTSLYQSQFTLTWHALNMLFVLPAGGMSLGVIGAWIATARHLSAIEPS